MNRRDAMSPGQRLQRERIRLNWSQERLAETIRTTPRTINRWEHDRTVPQPHYREQLCHIFNCDVSQFFDSFEEAGMDTLVPLMHIPFARNAYFTGRQHFLSQLHDALRAKKEAFVTRCIAITGLGGIGKTQLAIEYAYHYSRDYQAILWLRADTPELLFSDMAALAQVLDLPEQYTQDQRHLLEAVRHWLNLHSGWLLILDNLEDLALVKEIYPLSGSGYVLITTRSQATGTLAQTIELEQMTLEEGIHFLLRRAKRISSQTHVGEIEDSLLTSASAIVQEMDGLPLAIDQAGAYLEETGCNLTDYLALYRCQQSALLDLRGQWSIDHPLSVLATLSLVIEQVEQYAPAAAEVLRLCAFLHPDSIPEEMLAGGALELAPTLQMVVSDPFMLDTACSVLRRYSLVRRNPGIKTLSVHRLVQAVLKEKMDEHMQRKWAEQVVRMVNRTFPDVGEISQWPQCERIFPHVQVCLGLIERWQMQFPEVGGLLTQTGRYLMERGQYKQAEVLLVQARDISIHRAGEFDLSMAESLDALGELLFHQGKYEQVEPLFQQALKMREQLWGSEHPLVASSLNNLATLYSHYGNYTQAEPLHQRALAIRERALGSEHPLVALSLSHLAWLYYAQRRYDQAEPLHQRALAIRERALGSEHPHVALSLSQLAMLYCSQGNYDQAEPLYQRALNIHEKVWGSQHPLVASSLNNLGKLYHHQGNYVQAEPLLKQALAIRKHVLGPAHLHVANSLNCLAKLYVDQGRYARAKPLYQRALALREQALGPGHPDVITLMEDYAVLLRVMKRETEATKLVERYTTIRATCARDTSAHMG